MADTVTWVMKFASPVRATAWVTAESWCMIERWKSQETVCRPGEGVRGDVHITDV